MKIRTYTSKDESAVIILWQDCKLSRSWNNPKLDIERKLKDSPDLFFVGTINYEIVSSVMAGYDGHRGWVHYLAVHPEYQKQGLGRQIMEYAEAALKDLGCPKVDLMVRNTNVDVISFYKKNGYGQEDVVIMSRRLIEDEPYTDLP